MKDPQTMQPHELEAELNVRLGHFADRELELRWMRLAVVLHRRIVRLEAVNKRQLEYYRTQPETRDV